MRGTATHIMGKEKGKRQKNPASGHLHVALGLLLKTFVTSEEYVKRDHEAPGTEICTLLYCEVME